MNQKKHENIQNRINNLKEKKQEKRVIESGNLAFNIAVELVAGVVVGLIIGLFFDKMFDSKPIFLIICLMLAIIAAFRSIWNKYIRSNGT